MKEINIKLNTKQAQGSDLNTVQAAVYIGEATGRAFLVGVLYCPEDHIDRLIAVLKNGAEAVANTNFTHKRLVHEDDL